jgi:hypothetical protein
MEMMLALLMPKNKRAFIYGLCSSDEFNLEVRKKLTKKECYLFNSTKSIRPRPLAKSSEQYQTAYKTR